MNPQLYSDLNDRLTNMKDWTPDIISFDIDNVQHNLIHYIGKQCLKENAVLYFPAEFSMNMNEDDEYNKQKRDELTLALRIAASEAGFALICKGWTIGEQRMYFKCQQHTLYVDKRTKIKDKESSTIRPVKKEEKCPFGFPVIWDDAELITFPRE
jgi:hypothetical protein